MNFDHVHDTPLIENEPVNRDKNGIWYCPVRGSVSMGSMGSMEPINFQGRVLEPINILGNSIERWNLGNKTRCFQQFNDDRNPSILNPNGASDPALKFTRSL